MNKWYGIAIAIGAGLFCACKQEATLSYKVKNIASDNIVVVSALPGDSLIYDTTTIGYNQTHTIRVVDEGKSHISTYKESGPFVTAFGALLVYRDSVMPSSATLLATSRWSYVEQGASRADYILTVTQNDF